MAMAVRIPVFYYFQSDSGDDNRHPNVFEVFLSNENELNFQTLLSQFPLRQTGNFHWRFRKTIPGRSGYVWQDMKTDTSTGLKTSIPRYGGNIFAKILRLDSLSCSKVPLTLRRLDRRKLGITKKQGDLQTPESNGPRSNYSSLDTNTTTHTNSRHPRVVASKNKNQNQNQKSLGASLNSKDELLDLLSGGEPGTSSKATESVSMSMATSSPMLRSSQVVDELPAHMKGASAEVRASARIQMRQQKDIEAQRAKVLEKSAREAEEANQQNSRAIVAKTLGPSLQKWSCPDGTTKNIRALLGTLHTVLWEGANW
eukprot:CAMPEP_0204876410 /NCGR_PEP_ID=MMETSP1348-20121228/47624_1 /ASSEMBLY_ACC=CAM_ASM_000700 /TAXON_ID=215587 /ORGANISM="Aplanochytrium stocchinoi, Strain GSBS06" /LENGTH=312 /DNA_ID=CAMNT_0052033167 /DNA_START=72 /DNA_END=1007 /DNA_ORIENTATION=+